MKWSFYRPSFSNMVDTYEISNGKTVDIYIYYIVYSMVFFLYKIQLDGLFTLTLFYISLCLQDVCKVR